MKSVAVRFYSNGFVRNKTKFHAYSHINPWSSVEKFSQALRDNVLYNKDGLVIINKPYGVGSHLPQTPPPFNTAIVGDENFYLSQALPSLSKALGYPELSIVKAPERYTSGVAILSADEEVTSKVKKSMKKSSGRKHFSEVYLVLTVGCPNPSSSSQTVGLKLESSPLDGSKKPLILKEWSNNAVSRKEAFLVKVEHSTLKQSKKASLVEVRSSKYKWHFLRVYMAHLLSPILGDHLYGSRVQNVLGVPLSVSPFSDTAQQNQRLSDEILTTLNLRRGEEVVIPAHVHLHQVTLLDYIKKYQHLEVVAPLPEHFLWTCKQFLLHDPEPVLELSHLKYQ